jgi:hypothetical protein
MLMWYRLGVVLQRNCSTLDDFLDGRNVNAKRVHKLFVVVNGSSEG